ncbi:MAG: hypothetical protein OEX22_02860 [Cyclobacteriaceae bacterium]|nr:hypothetical protein [Cyclobacteriaceae bacterium]
MAKKKNELEENINDENQGFNDIDENFGLPDLDYKPVDELEEESVSEEIAEEEISQPSQEGDSEVTLEENSNEDEFSMQQDDPEISEEITKNSSDEIDDGNSGGGAGYVSGTYAKKTQESSSGGKTIGIIVTVIIIVAIGAGSYFWFVMRPKQVAAEKAKQEQIAKDKADKRKKEDYTKLVAAGDAEFSDESWSAAHSSYSQASALYPEEQYPLDQLAIVQEKLDEIAAQNAKPKIGEIETISAPTKRYYVIVSSSIDGDLAMDFANKIIKSGDNVGIIEPYGKNKYFRVTLGNYDTWKDAESASSSFSSTYGNEIWVLKY